MTAPWVGAHRFPIRVYYEDTDFSGVVYHANYLRFLERGRTEFLRAHGIDQMALHAAEAGGAAIAVRHMSLDFQASAGMDDALVVETRIASLGGASVGMAQRIWRDAALLVEASVRIGLVAGGRVRRLPRTLVDRLQTVGPEVTRGDVTIS